MRFPLLFVVFFLVLTGCSTYRVYIVRHAEKSTEPANDPHLSTEGKARAEFLKTFLKEKNIRAVFSTDRARTMETATPLSELINIRVEKYGNDTLGNFLQRLIRLKKNALIVGHSNTVVEMTRILDLPHNITFIPEDDYDNLFIIKVKNNKALKIIESNYGMLSPAVK